MRIATWNLEWAKPGTPRHRRALDQLESVGADIVVTTEDSLHEWDAYPHRIDGGDDWGYPIAEGRRKVIAWSRSPWSDIEAATSSSTAGRLVSGTTTIGGSDLHVIAVCIPWRDAHVRTGRRDRKIWSDHLRFCEELASRIERSPGPLVVAGDFNQRIPRSRQPQHVFEALADSLDGLAVATSGDHEVGKLIDHVAASKDLIVRDVRPWPNVVNGHRLTDHSGVVVEFAVS